MKISTEADFDAAVHQLAKLAEVAPVNGLSLSAMAEAMLSAGAHLLVRELGPADAATYAIAAVSAAIRGACD